MSLIVKERTGSDLEPIEEGVHVAVCYGVIDLGTRLNPTFGKEEHKVLIQWELPDVRIEYEKDGKKLNLPRAISKRYTLSLGKKSNLRKDLEAWRGRAFTANELAGFDLKNILGSVCQIQIVHAQRDDKVFANVGTIMSLPKSVPKPSPENPPVFFGFEEDEKPNIPDLPEWVMNIIKESNEYKALVLGQKPASKPQSKPASDPHPEPDWVGASTVDPDA